MQFTLPVPYNQIGAWVVCSRLWNYGDHMTRFLSQDKAVSLFSVLYSACLCALVTNWLNFFPYNSNPFGSMEIDIIFSSFARAILPALLVVLVLHCRPLPRNTVIGISVLLTVVLFSLTVMLLLKVAEIDSPLHLFMVSIGSACIGWFYNLAGVVFSQMNVNSAIFSIFLGRALSAAIIFLTLVFNRLFYTATILVSIIIIFVLISVYPWEAVEKDDIKRVSEPAGTTKLYASDLFRALVPIFFYCVAFGAMHLVPYQIDGGSTDSVFKSIWVLSIIVCVAVAFMFTKNASVRSISNVFKAIIILSALGLSLQIASSIAARHVGYVLFSMASYTVPSIWLSLATLLSGKVKAPAYVVFAVGTPTLLLPIGIGQIIGTLLDLNLSAEYEVVFTACCTLLLIFSALSVNQMDRWLSSFTKKRTAAAKEAVEAAEKPYNPLTMVEAKYGLTQRELDVVAILGKGHTYEYCAVSLGISINTTRSYVKSLYRKLNVNSREELLEIIDNVCTNNPP